MTLRTELERIAVLEQKYLDMSEDVHETRKQVSEMHDLLMQAKGARYVIIGAAMIAGGITGFLVKLIPWINAAPLK